MSSTLPFIENVTWQKGQVSKSDRAALNGQKPFLIWLTGLSGSGKTTLANELDAYFISKGIRSYLLDGDNVRHGLNSDLGFDQNSRIENIRRISEVARLMVDAGLVVITAFISPYLKEREKVRSMFEKGEFIEVYLKTPLSICEQRDSKGLYKRARQGKIIDFTGINSPYEAPVNPEIIIDSYSQSIEQELSIIKNYLIENRLINADVDN